MSREIQRHSNLDLISEREINAAYFDEDEEKIRELELSKKQRTESFEEKKKEVKFSGERKENFPTKKGKGRKKKEKKVFFAPTASSNGNFALNSRICIVALDPIFFASWIF